MKSLVKTSFYIETDIEKGQGIVKVDGFWTSKYPPAVTYPKKKKKIAKAHVASVAVMNGTKLLMGKRNDNGRWTLPGGHFDDGEDMHDAVAREMKEEAGIEASDGTLEHLGCENVTTFTGKKNTIHAFKLHVTDKVRPSSKNDPDEEVGKWEWIETKDGLPAEIAVNLHSPKNVVLQKLGLQAEKSMFFINDLIKARPHKYIRKYQRGGKWIYIYHEAGQHPRVLSEEAIKLLKKAADAGHEESKQLHDSIEAHDEEKLKLLRQAADMGHQPSHDHLKSLGIDRKAERLEEALVPRVVAPKDELDVEPTDPAGKQHIERMKKNVKEEVDAALTHLRQHRDTPIGQKILSTLESSDLMAEVNAAKTARQVLDATHALARKLEIKQGETPAQRPGEHRTYGNMIYNRAMEKHGQSTLPKEYARVHKRTAGTERHAHQDVKPFRERQAEAERQEQERRRVEEERRREEERRISAELEGSLASHMNSLLERPLPAAETKRLHQALKSMFGKNMRKEDWPYDFTSKGYTVKITSISFGGDTIDMDLRATDRNGNQVTRRWGRMWQKSGGSVKIYNSILEVSSSARNSANPIGALINEGQLKLLRTHAPEGKIAVTAALDVGGYNWANQGFEFSDSGHAADLRRAFKSFLSQYGISLTDEELSHFKLPCHFSSFDTGLRIEKNGMQVHLGKAFLLGRSWSGVMYATPRSELSREAQKHFENYQRLKTRSWQELSTKFVVKRHQGEGSTTRTPPRTTATTTAPPRPASSASSPHREEAERYVRRWARSGRNIVLTERRLLRIRNMSPEVRAEFLRLAPLTRNAMRRIRAAIG